MSNKVEFSKEITEVLDKLNVVLVKNYEASKVLSVQDLSTEKLVDVMESIFVEIRLRNSAVDRNTLALHELPVGAKVRNKRSKYYGAPITFLVADHNFYGDNKTTLLAERILAFKAFDAAEPNNPDSRRAEYGNNNYQDSNIHQWLNSDQENWFTPSHEYDQAPTSEHVYENPYADERGFLDSLSPPFRRNVQGDVFLLSAAEVGLSDEGKSLALFDNAEFRKAKPTPECVQIDEEGDANEPDWWWLRTPYSGFSYIARSVYASGVISHHIAHIGYFGIRPALNFSSDARVTAVPDEDGIYEIVSGFSDGARSV